MRNRGRLTLALASAVVVLVIGTFAYVLHARTQAQTASYPGLKSPVSVVCPGPTDTVSAQGSPAIQPRNNCTPAFTEQDVRDYLAHGVGLLKIEVVGQPTVSQVVFLTIRDLGQATGDGMWEANYPADLVVCYAVLRGTFRVFGPPASGTVYTNSTASILFDAHTGNQLVVSTPAALG